MPRIQPLNQEVDWPREEGAIGVVGVAPWATLDFLRALYDLVPATKDWHYPRVLADINTKLPSRGRHLELGERNPAPYIRETIEELAAQGADCAVVPCNTAHILFDQWSSGTSIPVLSIVDSVLDELAGTQGPVAVLASASIARFGLYERALEARGMAFMGLSQAQQSVVNQAIAEVKVDGRASVSCMERVESMLDEFAAREAGGIVLGCTELAGLLAACKARVPVAVESNAALARRALQFVGLPPGGAGCGSMPSGTIEE
jgi:aspartate racemase